MVITASIVPQTRGPAKAYFELYPAETKKSPHSRGVFTFSNYFSRPEPGPLGVNVDPLGEGLGASVFPDGFMVLFGLELTEPLEPTATVEPVVLPFMDESAVEPLADGPPVVELPPAPAAPPVCASASVLESANAEANAIVVSFI